MDHAVRVAGLLRNTRQISAEYTRYEYKEAQSMFAWLLLAPFSDTARTSFLEIQDAILRSLTRDMKRMGCFPEKIAVLPLHLVPDPMIALLSFLMRWIGRTGCDITGGEKKLKKEHCGSVSRV